MGSFVVTLVITFSEKLLFHKFSESNAFNTLTFDFDLHGMHL